MELMLAVARRQLRLLVDDLPPQIVGYFRRTPTMTWESENKLKNKRS